MRLLVSVRSAEEARAAWQGGADIIDAKEPSAGALAPVAASVLQAIAEAVPPHVPLSAALGDVGSAYQAAAAVAALAIPPRQGSTYAKFGLLDGARRVPEIVRGAVAAARKHVARPQIVVAAYVDRLRSIPNDLRVITQASAEAGACGVLLDTASKNGRNLFDWCDVAQLVEFAELAQSLRLKAALAGSVNAKDLPSVRETGADIIGVRGVVCDGGRLGILSEGRVRALAELVRIPVARKATGT